MKIINTSITLCDEPLKAPFGFKGRYANDLWNVVCKVETEKTYGIGVGTQSVLWSDAAVFAAFSEKEGNTLMYQITRKALTMLEGKEGATPIELIDSIYPELLAYAKAIIGFDNLRETFVKNALVAVDNALWQAYGKEQNTENLMELIPQQYLPALAQKQEVLCNIPLITYGVSEEEIKQLLDQGIAILKIKIGFNNGGKFTKEEMLEWDKNRIQQIHRIADSYTTPYTVSGHVLYYMDANGQYDTVERVQKLLDYAKEIGALEHVVLLEEPLDEENRVDVSSLPVRVAADESVHALKDVKERIALGYTAVALKPIAKTLSETLKILEAAYENNVPCFCADLTVCPIMVEWNKNIAARINRLPEMKVGIMESNGAQNYTNWDLMCSYEPAYGEKFATYENGVYQLDDTFYAISGGIFRPSAYYDNLF